jgi:hypothetical protein
MFSVNWALSVSEPIDPQQDVSHVGTQKKSGNAKLQQESVVQRKALHLPTTQSPHICKVKKCIAAREILINLLLFPHFNHTVPTTCEYDRGFQRVPYTGYRWSIIMCMVFLQDSEEEEEERKQENGVGEDASCFIIRYIGSS